MIYIENIGAYIIGHFVVVTQYRSESLNWNALYKDHEFSFCPFENVAW